MRSVRSILESRSYNGPEPDDFNWLPIAYHSYSITRASLGASPYRDR
ncbi:hypothetical protein [Pseudomonas phage PhL_UNISO_PA-DSM_ph0034]|uniref:Uncharacterized protein n=1 Tax=Pseudomonas phage PhL_UNISO_PA-DSM_ph0034 TaxID=2812900 RepID=A0A9E6Q6V4_9CAUD|nr:hypothetical protein QE329_gp189 [Pseudomonas phage PhL_UNISO_PA-DSM_ph0034]QYC95278.1 hypothetical protein [Pseudomonas phage PhL_UNISO_PA-DSM_ph0034]